MTTILVLGRDGQVGNALSHAAWPQGWTVAGTGRSDVDLTQAGAIAAAIDRHAPQLVINAAAYTAVDKAETERDLAFAVNADAPATLGRLAARLDIPVLHVSTDYVFDGSGNRPWRESDPAAPLNVYGASKLAGEQALLDTQPRSMILRTSWVYAAHGNNFVKTMLRLGRERDEISVVADQHGAPTSADDIASALVRMSQCALSSNADPSSWGIFHYTGAGETTWHGLATHIFDALERKTGKRTLCHPITTAEYPTPAARPRNSRLDCSKIAGTFGIAPRDWHASVDAILARLI